MIQTMSDSVKDNLSELSEVEKEFWKTQSTDVVKCHYIWKGDLSTLINWSSEIIILILKLSVDTRLFSTVCLLIFQDMRLIR